MPLSEHEQRLLEQIERALYQEDPKFASSVSGSRMSKPARRRRIQGAVLFVVGLVLLVAGIPFQVLYLGDIPVLSVVGFLAMLGGALLAVTSIGARGGNDAEAAEGEATPPKDKPGGENGGFTDRMEERFRRRFEQE
ncbi:transmembrane protein [Pseudonocardia sp. Ae168_Ps1]|uniref:DUF3040 domain-containing protein n=1 Tax=unclassified Pseudonocardia TaxID=2619320 RepID=UPI00094AAAE7|nr:MULTISPECIES: DUF3040 domain-containing protein [unclassified Pseudonocardia]OLL71236.1 transmembrane protein [Pseudonocardia sp. Ae168_Ps1]OLL77211.1 transmembrane protein [Pseudonocardia sp. Ae150A_Ps1]OLL88680.1 transmembrane protein [Pseudonocardia sp. Ae263_Ps1]OLL91299.1 transmembrane protein [Pseudonocardia sp. Ae356_Ps1]